MVVIIIINKIINMNRIKTILEEKLNKKFHEKINPYEYFFGHVINNITTLDSRDEGYAEHNFSGLHSASNDENAEIIKNYIITHIMNGGKHCDVGASIARLSKKLIDYGIDSYAIDGHDYGIRHDNILIPKNKYAVCDMGMTDISDLDFEKEFELTTAFEITEHIPEEMLDLFYKNCAYMSKKHLCSVHWGGDDNSKNAYHNHYNVKPTSWWIDYLSKFGNVTNIEFKIPTFNESDVLFVEFN